MIERLQAHFPSFDQLEESSLEGPNGIVAWQTTVIDSYGESISSGFSKEREQARKIAIAEFIERQFLKTLTEEKARAEWRLHTHPTSCGFAAGFDLENTKIRSVCEAIERWALSKWIDQKFSISMSQAVVWPKECTPLVAKFNDHFVFKKDFVLPWDIQTLSFCLCVVVFSKDGGAYMGSAVRHNFDDALSHSIVEAHRHLLISTQARNFLKFPFNRIKFFSENRSEAIRQILDHEKFDWPAPRILFQKHFQNDLFMISRTILDDWTPWEQGPLDRMLY